MPKKAQSRILEQALPEIKEGIYVCRVGVARGGSQFEVWDGESTWLAELPKRFRNTIWIRRGSFVLVDTSSSSANTSGTRGEIVFVLQKEHILQLKKQAQWQVIMRLLILVLYANNLESSSYRPPRMEETQGNTPGANKEVPPREGANDKLEEGEHADGSSDSDIFQNNNRQ
ncbi:hypothetical protein FRC07_005622 [Ceratobasidium sp. 392]|nr:hypothetical protein FRC07_005622 [Ceratobasidium sp. 392]